jgi:hypothetical protein
MSADSQRRFEDSTAALQRWLSRLLRSGRQIVRDGVASQVVADKCCWMDSAAAKHGVDL